MMIQILDGIRLTNKANNTTAEGSAQQPTQDTANCFDYFHLFTGWFQLE